MAHCTQHRIKYDTLYNIVLEQIRACARKALADEQEAAAKLRENSQTEQATLKNRVMLNRERLAQQTQKQEDSTRWLEIIKDYAGIQELDAVTLNQLVQKAIYSRIIRHSCSRLVKCLL